MLERITFQLGSIDVGYWKWSIVMNDEKKVIVIQWRYIYFRWI